MDKWDSDFFFLGHGDWVVGVSLGLLFAPFF